MTPPPNDETAERVVICGLLRDYAAVWPEVARAGLRRADLYHHRHRLVWDAARGVGAVAGVAAAWEVWRHLGRAGHWPEFGEWRGRRDGRLACAAWLLDTLDLDPTGYWALRDAAKVRDLAARRRVIHAARKAIRDALAGVPVAELVAV